MQYDNDRITYTDGIFNSLMLSNGNQNYLNLHRVNNYLVKSSASTLDYPIYNFSNPKDLKIKCIGKGVDVKLPVNEYKIQMEENIFRKYR